MLKVSWFGAEKSSVWGPALSSKTQFFLQIIIICPNKIVWMITVTISLVLTEQFGSFLKQYVMRIILTNTNPDGDVPSTSQITHKDDCNNVSDLVRGCDETGKAGRDLKPLLNCCYHRVDISRAQSLLESYEE